jgi:hypothetical protein
MRLEIELRCILFPLIILDVDRTVSRHRSGEEYQNISAALKIPKNTVASIILEHFLELASRPN